MMKPAMMHFISEIPLPAAYGANDLTRNADVKANRILQSALNPKPQAKIESKPPRKNKGERRKRLERGYSKQDVKQISNNRK